MQHDLKILAGRVLPHRAMGALARAVATCIVFAATLALPGTALAATTLHKDGFGDIPAQHIVFDNLDLSKATITLNNSAFSKASVPNAFDTTHNHPSIVWKLDTSGTKTIANPYAVKFANAGYDANDGSRIDLVLSCTKIEAKALANRTMSNTRMCIMYSDLDSSGKVEGDHVVVSSVGQSGYASIYGVKQTFSVRVYKTGTTTVTSRPLLCYVTDLDTPDYTVSPNSWSGGWAEGINLVSGYGTDTYVAASSLLVAESSNTRFRGTAHDDDSEKSAVAFTLNASGGTITWTSGNAGCSTRLFKSYVKQIKATSGTGGSIKASGTNATIASGKNLTENVGWRTNKTYTITPATGYKISAIKVDGAAIAVSNAAGQTYTFGNVKANHTIEATYAPITYKIVFDGNGASSGSTAAMTGLKGDVSYNLTKNGFQRKGHTFMGWNTKADGTGTSYADGASVKNLTTVDGGTVTLYARWDKDVVPQRTVIVRIPEADYALADASGYGTPAFAAIHGSGADAVRCLVDFSDRTNADGYVVSSRTVEAPADAVCTLANNTRFAIADTRVDGLTTIFTMKLIGLVDQASVTHAVNHVDIDDDAQLAAMGAMSMMGAPLLSMQMQQDDSMHEGQGVTLAAGGVVNEAIPASVKAVTFTDDPVPENAAASDLSAAADQSVAGYLAADGTYVITSGIPGIRLLANEDCSHMLEGKMQLERVDTANLDLSTARDISFMFAGCRTLETVDASAWDTLGVERATGLFQACTGLARVDFGPDWFAGASSKEPPAFPVAMEDESGRVFAVGDAIPSGAGTYLASEAGEEVGTGNDSGTAPGPQDGSTAGGAVNPQFNDAPDAEDGAAGTANEGDSVQIQLTATGRDAATEKDS